MAILRHKAAALLLALALFSSVIALVAAKSGTNAIALAQAKLFKTFASGFISSNGAFDTWASDDPCDGSWTGIRCNTNGTVVILDLNGNGLNGSLPAVIGELISLDKLYLYNNHLYGKIPTELAYLKWTTEIWLFNNDLTGTIPSELGNLTSCLELHLFNNELTGAVPKSLKVIDDLKVLPGNSLCATTPGAPCPSPPPPPPPPAPVPTSPPHSPPPPSYAAAGPAYPPWSDGLTPPQDLFTYPPPLKESTSAPAPAPSCEDCAEGLTRGIDNCTCVHAQAIELRFTALDFASYTSNVEEDLLNVLAAELDLQTAQLQVTDRRSGSVILDIQILPLTGSSLSEEEISNITSKLISTSSNMPPQYVYQVIEGPGSKGKSSAPIGIIVGSICGGIAFIVFLLVGYKCLQVRKLTTDFVATGTEKAEKKWTKKAPLKKQIVYTSVWTRKSDSSASDSTLSPPTTDSGMTDSGVKRLEEGDKRDERHPLPKRVLAFEAEPRKASSGPLKTLEEIAPKTVDVFTLREIQVATKDFNKVNLIAEGTYGRIYKAQLTFKQPAQVLVLSNDKLNIEDFLRLVQQLGALVSQHLVSLIGYSGERGHRILVYEHVANGSLLDHLHGELRFGRQLNWSRRVRIARDVAQALSFLHQQGGEARVHRDLRASNVMLDAHFHAKLGECGLATLVTTSNSKSMSAALLAGVPYQAPEMRTSGVVTSKSDVFSYGVIMLELFTGRKPLDEARPKGQQSLLNWMLPHIGSRRALQSMVDPYLRLNSALDPRALQKFATLASRCLQTNPDARPPIHVVLQEIDNLIKEDISSDNNSESMNGQGGFLRKLAPTQEEVEENSTGAESARAKARGASAPLSAKTPPSSIEDWNYIKELARQFPPGLDGWAEVWKSNQSTPSAQESGKPNEK